MLETHSESNAFLNVMPAGSENHPMAAPLQSARDKILAQALHQAVTYHGAGMLSEAEEFYRVILQEEPDHADANHHLGVLALQAKQPDAALPYLLRAYEMSPLSASFCLDLADALIQTGGLFRAWHVLNACPEKHTHALSMFPLLMALSRAMESLSTDECVHLKGEKRRRAQKRYIAVRTGATKMHEQVAATQLLAQSRYAELEAMGIDLLMKYPLDNFCWELFGLALFQGRGGKGADICLVRAVELAPNLAENQYNLGGVLTVMGRLQEAEVAFRSALRIDPNDVLAYMNLLYCISHSPHVSATHLFAEHRKFGELFEQPLKKYWPRHTNSKDPERIIRIGFVSPDFRTHVVAKFMVRVLEGLAKDPSLCIVAYYTHAEVDDLTDQIRRHFAEWNHLPGVEPADLATAVMGDNIDILVDLSGHTRFNRLLAFARKPAPLQVSWVGYPGTTGLDAMDYYLADKLLCPPGDPIEQQFTEKIVRLPTSGILPPDANMPEPGSLPALKNKYLTFGSFNRMGKISSESIALWSKLLHELPDARLLIGDVNFQEGADVRLIEQFACNGITRDRLQLEARRDMQGYLALHQEVDLCLDTLPYGGGTTTFHAMHMGVPTISLVGDTFVRRLGLCISSQYGCENFAVFSESVFIELAVYWSKNLEELAKLRTELSQRMRSEDDVASKHQQLVAGVGRAFRTMWRNWCEGREPESFDA